jgi:N utilization substance protein B
MQSPRRRSREVALQVLCALDGNPELDVTSALARYFTHLAGADDGETALPSPDTIDRPFMESLVRGVHDARGELDRRLGEISRTWRVERMAVVDRNILRLGLHELKGRSDTPARVAINEAVELAKRYGSEESPGFVNGILDSALRAA